jgi:hypothetical protein
MKYKTIELRIVVEDPGDDIEFYEKQKLELIQQGEILFGGLTVVDDFRDSQPEEIQTYLELP